MRSASPFTAVAAVETWDACFRWRDAGGLRDRTIEATWWRVARAIAADRPQASTWAQRYFEAFWNWRLLPDEALLRSAGTHAGMPAGTTPSATLDIAAFVHGSRVDVPALADTAALAVRLLDDARLAGCTRAGDTVRVGVLGMAAALGQLGIDYDSGAARELAATLASALAHGTLRGAVELARERGRAAPSPMVVAARSAPGLDAGLRADFHQWGARYSRLTAIAPQPLLARLANAATDALDPAPAVAGTPLPSLIAQLQLRAAMQPWIDVPIDYPLAVPAGTGDAQFADARRFAIANGLAEPILDPAVIVTAH